MKLQQVYLKTAKGQEEIQKRCNKLPASLRKLLIMVDGHSTAEQMIERLASMGDVTAALDTLEGGGFIAPLLPPPQKTSQAPVPTPALPTHAMLPADDPKSERMLLHDIWDTEDSGALLPGSGGAQPAFNLDKAKGFVRCTLLAAIGVPAARRIDRIEATTSVEELRVELDAVHEVLPQLLPKRQAEQVWKQLEPLMLPFSTPDPPAATLPSFNLDKPKNLIRFTLLGAMGPTAARRIDRIEAVTSTAGLQVELEDIHAMLFKVLSKRQAEQAWKQLEPIIFSIALPPG